MSTRIYNFLASVRLAIVLFIALAVTAIFGTVIQQGLPAAHYEQLYSPRLFSLFHALDLFDMYHSWWFMCLLGLLAVNITLCTVRQTPPVIRQVFPRTVKGDASFFTPSRTILTVGSTGDQAALDREIRRILKARVAEPRQTGEERERFFFAERGRWSRLGMLLVHFSILLILGGGLIGTIYGFNGEMTIIEGEQASRITVAGREEPVTLGFDLRCDDFTVDFYPNGMPKKFKTDLTVIEKGERVLSHALIVNDPLFYRGLRFYQATYGIASASDFEIALTDGRTGREERVRLTPMQKVPLPDSDAFFAVARFTRDYKGFGPAVLGVFITPDRPHEIFWLPYRDSHHTYRAGDFTFSFVDFNRQYYSGIQVTKDPGSLVVHAGFILILLGLAAGIFFSHKRAAVRVIEKGDTVEITVAATANKNRRSFEESLLKAFETLGARTER